MTVTDAIASSRGSARRDAVTITWLRSEKPCCATAISGTVAASGATKNASLTCQLLHALHARSGLIQERQGRGDRARNTRGIATGLASPSASRPLPVSAGLRACEWICSLRPHLPVLSSTVVLAVSGSLTVAWAAPALHSFSERAPASRFTPGAP